MEPPFSTNLANYLRDIRDAGFTRVTLTFDARFSVDPAARFGPYDPATFDATWGLIRDARGVLKQNGPDDTRVDLLNEGTPFQEGPPALVDWDARMYTRYVDAFGAGDVSFSAAIGSHLDRLVETLRSTGEPLPSWFDLHPGYDPSLARADLFRWNAEMAAAGLAQPLVIGEVKYNDPGVAQVVSDFAQTSGRRVEEVMEFRAVALSIGGQPRRIDPPYRIEAYAKALWGAPFSSTLTATVTDKKTTFVTARGRPVTALESGSYVVVVNDRSKKRGFSFAGHATSKQFRGRASWQVSLTPGEYGAVTLRSGG